MTEHERAVPWRDASADPIPDPLVRRVPYLELTLEHPGLDPTGHDDRFFPDAVPYALNGEPRVFYWRSALSRSATATTEWQAACATTSGFDAIGGLPSPPPSLTTRDGDSVTVVVDGTVAGETTTARLDGYSPPDVRVEAVSESAVELAVDGDGYGVPAGERRRIELPERRVDPAGTGSGPASVAPELVARYPGRRVLHHPAPGSDSRLFPSFGLDVDDLPNPVPVPTAAGELDVAALAATLDVDLSDRPYPERVLWRAFAYTAFDPHGETAPELAQLRTGHIVLASE